MIMEKETSVHPFRRPKRGRDAPLYSAAPNILSTGSDGGFDLCAGSDTSTGETWKWSGTDFPFLEAVI